jgi:hypothetical protein
MTGALLHDHYAPPGNYLAQVPYWSYLKPAVVQRYSLVNPQTVRVYRSAPQPFQGGSRLPRPPPAWHWQSRPEPAIGSSGRRPLNPPPTPLTASPLPIQQKPNPMPLFGNPTANPEQRPERLDRSDRPGRPDRTVRPDRSDLSSTGNSGPSMGDRKSEEKK